ncbi:glycosyltransferase [Sporosarcina sp. E16_3]|uniref:glycosyltransferase n=1 Tax=Sporosarcina sp. E16_3 TaxID=2789293 RepID=UPI001A9116CB|nr:glycosyltransferase [Sporosarcina sp. E16_3]MBO0602765.1 glycosyltransferase [Sporosarcina sp. E16_3]
MAKNERIEVAEFIDGEYVFLNKRQRYMEAVGVSAATSTLLMPLTSFAAGDSNTFIKIYEASMRVVDAGVVFVIIFAGATWILGNRPKSLELLLGASAGYLIIRNAVHIRDGLKSLVPEMGGL